MIDASNDNYVNIYKNMDFRWVPVYIESNKKSSERLLIVNTKLNKAILDSITLLKLNIRKFPDQEINYDDNAIKDYNKTINLYHLSAIIKKSN